MASAGQPINHAAAAAPHNFDEDLLDEDDDEESFDHDEDDDASSTALVAFDRPPPPTDALAQVTIAVPGIPDPQLLLHHHLHNNPQQQPENVAVAKRPMPPDESRKLFQRLWTDEDEIELLRGFLDYTTLRCGPHGSSQHHHDTTAFYDQIKSKFQLDFNKNQLVEKLRRLKKKYRNVISKCGSGKDFTFKSPHDQATFEISSKIWGNTAVPSAFHPIPPAPAPIDEDDDDFNNPNFADCQSPKLNGIDINSKTPRPRKRNRAGVVKLEDRQQHVLGLNSSNINSTHPSSGAAAAFAPMAPPGFGVGMGMTGSMSSVIEETVKSCLSPIFKELLSNSMSLSQNLHGPYCGHGLELARSPLSSCFAGGMGGGVDKPTNSRWRKQQILELEVFSKRLELVQDQIREQLEELRSIGN